jgi:1-acyl-sn-glycerol-3-phosphate acyltransferase
VRNWKKLRFPKVTVRFGDPIVFDRVADPSKEQQQQVANEIFTEIRGLYAELDAEGRAGVARRVRELRRAERSEPKGAAPA